MKKYRRLQAALAALVVGTFALGMVSAVRPDGEIFPFASWFLFSLVPQRVTAYEIRVREWDGNRIDPPTSIIDIDGLVRNPRSSTVYQLIQQYGAGLDPKSDRGAEAAKAWKLLRERINFCSLEVNVVRVRFDPLERWKTGRVDQEELIATGSVLATNADLPGRPAPRSEDVP